MADRPTTGTVHIAAAPTTLLSLANVPAFEAEIPHIKSQVSCSASMKWYPLSLEESLVENNSLRVLRRSSETPRFFICGRDIKKGTLPSLSSQS